MMERYITPMMTLFVLAVPVFTHAVTWEMDPAHSSFQFKVRHMTVSSVKGDFSKFRGVVIIDDKDITQMKVEMAIEAASVNTGHPQRDDHLRGQDFFDVIKYPAITFVSSKVTKADGDKLRVTGDLTIHGVTREITVDMEGPAAEVKDPGGNFRRGATATAKIDRRDFGLAWNKVLDSGGLVVGDEVNIYVEVELIRK
ncbi:MAG TPA: YceI family protein [Thermodesulfobacteriota bacterium]|nr:YceI family protein [Thermodesulfobacteriota bacterium]